MGILDLSDVSDCHHCDFELYSLARDLEKIGIRGEGQLDLVLARL
jgi:hypothetical protein